MVIVRTSSTAATAFSTAKSISVSVVKRPRLNLTDSNAAPRGMPMAKRTFGRFNRAGTASTASRDRDWIHVGYNCFGVSPLEENIGGIREFAAVCPRPRKRREALTLARRSVGHGASPPELTLDARSSVAMRAAAPNPTMPATFSEPDRKPLSCPPP